MSAPPAPAPEPESPLPRRPAAEPGPPAPPVPPAPMRRRWCDMSGSDTASGAAPGSEAEVLEQAYRIVEGAAPAVTRAVARRRRLQRALHDLGLAGSVGRGWVGIGDDGLAFADLDDRASDAFVSALEALVGLLEAADPRRAVGHLRALTDAPRAMGAPYSVN